MERSYRYGLQVVSGNRIYVGTRDGNVIAFGAPVPAPVTAPPPTFPVTVVGQPSAESLTVTANAALTLSSLAVSGPFSLGTPSKTLPAALAAGASITVPVTFTPTASGPAGGGITITTSAGLGEVTLSGSAEVSGPDLETTTKGLSLGGISPGSSSSQTVGFLNDGSAPVTISSVVNPSPPFSVTGAPSAGTVPAPGSEIVATVTFSPTTSGTYSDSLALTSDGGNQQVALTGISAPPPRLTISSLAVNYGAVRMGQSATESFQLSNTGGSPLSITKSKPPALGPFNATTALPEGTTIAPGATLTESVAFKPTGLGTTSDSWVINSTDGQGVRTVTFTGAGYIGDPSLGGWKLNGSALNVIPAALHLTQASALNQKGTAFWPTPVSSANLTATFTSYIGSGTGADGTTFLLANATDPTTSLGMSGVGLGFYGVPGIAVALDTHNSLGNPNSNFVGITDGATPNQSPPTLHWLVTNTNVVLLRAKHQITVTLSAGVLTMSIHGTQVLDQAITVGPTVLLGFTASSGAQTDIHSVANVSITAP